MKTKGEERYHIKGATRVQMCVCVLFGIFR